MTSTNRLVALSQIRLKDVFIELQKEGEIMKGMRLGRPLVAYAGWTGHGNLGDDILFDAHKALFPRLTFVPFSSRPLANAFGKIMHKPTYVAGFLGGGTLINQSPAWLQKMQYIHAQGLPIYCFGTGVTEDSFRLSFENTSLAEWAKGLKDFSYVGVRGPRSLALLKKAGFDNARIIGDTALALAPEKMKSHSYNGVIGFNYGLVKKTQIWGESQAYTQNVAKTIKRLITAGNEVRLLPVWADDIKSNEELLELVNSPKCTIRNAFSNLDSYTKELDECGLFIGQKLHSTIIACMERIPSIMIEYQPKCRDFMASIDMEDYIVKTSDVTPANILKKVAEMEKDYKNIRHALDNKVSGYRKRQYKISREIEESLLRNHEA